MLPLDVGWNDGPWSSLGISRRETTTTSSVAKPCSRYTGLRTRKIARLDDRRQDLVIVVRRRASSPTRPHGVSKIVQRLKQSAQGQNSTRKLSAWGYFEALNVGPARSNLHVNRRQTFNANAPSSLDIDRRSRRPGRHRRREAVVKT
jgi:hypothetical protein